MSKVNRFLSAMIVLALVGVIQAAKDTAKDKVSISDDDVKRIAKECQGLKTTWESMLDRIIGGVIGAICSVILASFMASYVRFVPVANWHPDLAEANRDQENRERENQQQAQQRHFERQFGLRRQALVANAFRPRIQ